MSTPEVKNFDTGGGRRGARLAQHFRFVLGGQEFTLRRGLKVGSDALDAWWPMLARMSADEDAPDVVPVGDPEFLETWRATMLALLVPGQDAVLEQVLENEVEPVMLPDLVEVMIWAVRTVTGNRPTDASSASSNGSTAPSTEPVATSSPVASSSPEAAPSTT
jgi:hypothetical protein